ncbi:MAG TPA: hypothetical protein VME47_17440 [Acetobacteraceae bacterium]|nr:hypothetical protein [Acetobacteraceae bacterium]
MPATEMDLFVQASSALCGIAQDKLAPALDPVNVKQAYFDTAQQKAPAAFAQLLKIVADRSALPPAALADLILNQSGDAVRFVARSIMLAWYVGSWYAPDDLRKYAGPNPPQAPIGFSVISMDAYTRGWAWSVAQAHPMGFSTMTFGYWSDPPPSLEDYIGTGATS